MSYRRDSNNITQPDLSQLLPISRDGGDQNLSSMRILLVDDNRDFLILASRVLSEDPNIQVVGCCLDGQDALEQAEVLRPDLVLMDLAMPGMNGLEATHRLKEQIDPPQVVMLTLHDEPEYRSVAREVGADGFVVKTNFHEELLPLIHHLRVKDSNPKA